MVSGAHGSINVEQTLCCGRVQSESFLIVLLSCVSFLVLFLFWHLCSLSYIPSLALEQSILPLVEPASLLMEF
jgi:hypothetical protein